MDPYTTAVLALFTLGLEVAKIAMDGQPVDVKAQLWREYAADADRVRHFFGLPTFPALPAVPSVPKAA